MSATAVEENNVTRDIAADRLGKDRLRVGQGGWGPVIDEAQRESRGACACLTKIAGEPHYRLIHTGFLYKPHPTSYIHAKLLTLLEFQIICLA